MDQSELEDHFFNESAVFYDIKKRNNALIKKVNASKENKGFTELKATSETKEEIKETKEEIKEIKKKNKQLSQAEILRIFKELKKTNPNLTFQDFCIMLANGEISLEKEDLTNEKK
jgi:hypothetical protein